MEQPKPTKKTKWGLFKAVVKWIWIAILVLLLIPLIIFKGPWKVITLLLVFLASVTILPAKFRKYFWITVGVVVVSLIIWIFIPQSPDDEWRPLTLDDRWAKLKAKYYVPDEENAAVIYKELFETYDPNIEIIDDCDLDDIVRTRAWTSQEDLEIVDLLKEHKNTIEKLILVSHYDKFYFPLDKSIFQTNNLFEVSKIKSLTSLLQCSANLDLGEGRIEEAIEKQNAIIRISGHFRQRPTMVSYMIAQTIETLSVKGYQRIVMHDGTKEHHLKLIEKQIKSFRYPLKEQNEQIVDYEKLLIKGFASLYYEINSKEKTRINLHIVQHMKELFEDNLSEDTLEKVKRDEPSPYLQNLSSKISAIFMWLMLPSNPQKIFDYIDQTYDEYVYVMVKPDYSWNSNPPPPPIADTFKLNYKAVCKLLITASRATYYRSFFCQLRTKAYRRGSLLIIALRRYKNAHGDWPGSLDEIKDFTDEENFVDPLNGGEYVYRLTDDGFMLYSKGKNGIDDGGEDLHSPDDANEPDDILIWPQKLELEDETND